jgi:hypothetical protein
MKDDNIYLYHETTTTNSAAAEESPIPVGDQPPPSIYLAIILSVVGVTGLLASLLCFLCWNKARVSSTEERTRCWNFRTVSRGLGTE